MAEPEPYSTPRGVENAIKDAAKKAAAADPSLDVNERIQLEYFNRFLSRVFSEAEDSEWVLKGGTGMLARVPSTRATRDIDLYRRGFTLAQALDDLIRLATVDLGDHFRFQYVSHAESIGNDIQPYTEGCQVRFEIFIGLSTRARCRWTSPSAPGSQERSPRANRRTRSTCRASSATSTASTPSSTRSPTRSARPWPSTTSAPRAGRRTLSTSSYSRLPRTSTEPR